MAAASSSSSASGVGGATRFGGLRMFIWLLAVALFGLMFVEMSTLQGGGYAGGGAAGSSSGRLALTRNLTTTAEDDDSENLLLYDERRGSGNTSSSSSSQRFQGVSRARLIHELERLENQLNKSKLETQGAGDRFDQVSSELAMAQDNATSTTQHLIHMQQHAETLKQHIEFYQKVAELKGVDGPEPIDLKPPKRPLPEGFYLHDKTLEILLDRDVSRAWFEKGSPKPPAQILLTSIGWNHPNQGLGLQFHRSKRETRIMASLVNHPWFHPSAWADINLYKNATMDPDVRYYVFPDWSTCLDGNWPKYGGHDFNYDYRYGRVKKQRSHGVWGGNMGNTVMFNKSNPLSKNAVYFTLNCGGWGPATNDAKARDKTHFNWSFASLSALMRNSNLELDQGLPPPGQRIVLTEEQVADIYSCDAETEEKRPLLLTQIANWRAGKDAEPNFGPRGKLGRFHDNKKVFILRHFLPEFKKSMIGNWSYAEILSKSQFSAAPRGDNKFSYRWTEVLAAGAIPIVMADDWLWPFRPELIDWSECAVILRENAALQTLKVIANLTTQQRCRMRQRCYDIYKQYIEDDRGVIAGLVEGFELRAQGKRAEPSGIRCTPEDDPRKTCNPNRRRWRR